MKLLSSSRLAILTTLLAPVSWGTTYIAVTEFLPAGRPLTLAALRVLPAGIALAGFGLLRTGWRPRGREWARTVAIATFSFSLFFPLLIFSTYRMPGGVAAAAGGLQPLLVAGFTALFTRRKPQKKDLIVGSVAALGVVLVVTTPDAALDALGVAAAVAATISFAFGVVLTKRFPTPADRIAATGWQLSLSAIVLVPLAWIVEGPMVGLDVAHIGAFAYLSLVTTGLAFVLWFSGIGRLPSAAPPLLGLAAPITGAALGWIVLGEALSSAQIAGFAITITAIATGVTLGNARTASTMPRLVRGRRRWRSLEGIPARVGVDCP
jgi:probable blue pigment (indigoidine) exporter